MNIKHICLNFTFIDLLLVFGLYCLVLFLIYINYITKYVKLGKSINEIKIKYILL
jgi:hypothetical protein